MIESELLEIFTLLGLTNIKPSGNFYYMVECPMAGEHHLNKSDRKPSCSIGHTDRPSRFNCFACGYSGSIMDAAYHLHRCGHITREACTAIQHILRTSKEASYDPEALQKKLEAINKKIQESYLDPSILDVYEKRISGWLLDRNLSVDTCKSWGIRHNLQNDMVVIPVFDKHGLRGITQRNIHGTDPKYLSNDGFKNHHFLFGEDHFADVCSPIPTSGGIIIVEGQFDTMYMHQLGFTNTLGLFSSNITDAQIKLLSRYDKPVYVFLDNDEAGYAGTKRAACFLSDKMPCYTVNYPESYPKKVDPKRLSKEQIIDLLGNAEYSLGSL